MRVGGIAGWKACVEDIGIAEMWGPITRGKRRRRKTVVVVGHHRTKAVDDVNIPMRVANFCRWTACFRRHNAGG